MAVRRFADRVDAGRALAGRLDAYRGTGVIVAAIPRGGVPVAAEIAAALDAPLDVVLVRKLGVPGHPELAFGAIGESGARVRNDRVVSAARLGEAAMEAVERTERTELERRAARYRGDAPLLELAGRTVIVVDDGVATGATARAACQVVAARGAGRVVLATPVIARGAVGAFDDVADEVVAVLTPRDFRAVGQFYVDFDQTGDDEVVATLARLERPDQA